MQFYEKLTFLMDLTQVSNRMLSQELQVDPSLISRLRRGNRRLPRNREHINTFPNGATQSISVRPFRKCWASDRPTP